MRYVVLLRGINVGGKNKVMMGDLRKYFEAAGFTSVKTYINSGNIILDSDLSDEKLVSERVTEVLNTHFDFMIASLVISAVVYQNELTRVPKWWGERSDYKHNALFLLPSADKQQIYQALSEFDSIYEQIYFGEQVIFWSAAFEENYSKTNYVKILKQHFYPDLTIRNKNTTVKLLSYLD